MADCSFEVVIVTEPTSDKRKSNQYWDKYNVNVRVFENEARMGFPKSILKLADLAEGDFVLFSSDEDFIESDSVPWLLETIENNDEVTRIIGGADHDVDEGKYSSKEALMELFWSQYHLTGHLMRKEVIDTSYAAQYVPEKQNALGPYIHQVLATQAMIAGVTLCTERDFWRNGAEQIHEHEVSYSIPEARVRQCCERIERVIPDLINDPSMKKHLLNEQRKRAATLLLRTVRSPRRAPTVLRIIINEKSIVRSAAFWYSLPIIAGQYIIRQSKNALCYGSKHVCSSI
ncbi:hypothetical protein GGP95_001228 [Salinibacter ruber]|nr:hypothetical protein [Salinibacter ruber]